MKTLIALVLIAGPTLAGVCTVPGAHPTIQAAIDDPACSQIQLAGQNYLESILIGRSLALAGPGGGGAVVAGRFTARGAGVVVTVTDVRVENGCGPQAVDVMTGASLDGLGFEVVSASDSPCPAMLLFADGFESGDFSAWSNSVP